MSVVKEQIRQHIAENNLSITVDEKNRYSSKCSKPVWTVLDGYL